jgi:4'-phosphopantetheinyl transferase EntD
MEFLNGISELFGTAANRLVWRFDPGLRLQAVGTAEEERTIAHAVTKRVREFRSGRNLARAALAGLGAPVTALPSGSHRMPDWPNGVVGSISHFDRLAVAVIGWRRDFSGLGIDVEGSMPFDTELSELVMTAVDRQFIAAGDAALQHHWAKTVFSAKEAFYKAVFPTTRQPLDFPDVAIQPLSPPAADTGTFKGMATSQRMARSDLCNRVVGRWLRHGMHVFCFAYLPAELPARLLLADRERTCA